MTMKWCSFKHQKTREK